MECIVLDVETTANSRNEVIEMAYRSMAGSLESLGSGDPIVQRFKPEEPVHAISMAVCGIMPSELEDCPPSSHAVIPDGVKYIVGHGVDFDWMALGRPDVKRIDTLALSRAAFPDFKSHKLGVLCYELLGEAAKDFVANAHSAKADIEMCVMVYRKCLEELLAASEAYSHERAWQLSEYARIPRIMPFGKHKGELIEQMPTGYCEWLLKQDNVDEYLAKQLAKRVGKKR